jgi:hypothetical protein
MISLPLRDKEERLSEGGTITSIRSLLLYATLICFSSSESLLKKKLFII